MGVLYILKMLVTRVPQDADFLQLAAQLRTRFAILFGQAVTQGAISKTQFKTLDQFGMLQPATTQVFLHFRRLLEGFVIVVDDLFQRSLAIGIGG